MAANIGYCRLCNSDGVLSKSHFIPNSYIKAVKKMGYGKSFLDTNGRFAQDFFKEYFLCGNCESIFCKYEKYFKENIYDLGAMRAEIQYDATKVKYFALSIAWRLLQHDIEQSKQKLKHEIERLKNLYCDTIDKHEFDEAADKLDKIYVEPRSQTLEKWRQSLLHENHNDIQQIPIYLLPIERIKPFTDIEGLAGWMSVSFGFRRKTQYAVIKIPKFFLICSTNDNISGLNEFQISGQLEIVYTNITQEMIDILIECSDELINIRLVEESIERAKKQKEK